MRPLNILFSAAAIAFLAGTGARAQMLVGTLQDVTSSTPYIVDLTSLSYAGFAVYAAPASPAQFEGVPYTDPNNVANFSALTGTFAATDSGGPIEITFPYVVNGHNLVAPLTTILHDAGAGHALSLTSTLFATTETFSFFLEDLGGPTSVTATLSGPGVTGTPTYSGSYSAVDGVSYDYEVLTLTVMGAQIGDLLTFSLVDPTTGQAGIQGVAISAAAVPEPASWLLLAGGAALLALWRRGHPLRLS